ncbi:MAG: hypothetical protein MJ082_01055 [Clostridia bacterium]|nr:hypothetical protein [Clostridia bacterium]
MKKILSLVLVLTLCFGLVAVLASCAPSGEYKDVLGASTYEFKGSKYTFSVLGSDPVKGKFKMGKDDNGNQTITLIPEGAEDGIPVSFSTGKDDKLGNYIKIAGVSYYKK